ncbi:hypothetical protein QQ045_015378 [Rhodiola kirilowii]
MRKKKVFLAICSFVSAQQVSAKSSPESQLLHFDKSAHFPTLLQIAFVKAPVLRSKISNCIDKASSSTQMYLQINGVSGEADLDDGESPEAESLLNIRVAHESQESQLASLQVGCFVIKLWKRKNRIAASAKIWEEAAVAETDYSCKMVPNRLKGLQRKRLGRIHEASAFASESVDGNYLIRPQYPMHLTLPRTSQLEMVKWVLHNDLTSVAKT